VAGNQHLQVGQIFNFPLGFFRLHLWVLVTGEQEFLLAEAEEMFHVIPMCIGLLDVWQ
jgi:hypothetical protein